MQGAGYQTDIDTGMKYGKLDRGGARALFDFRLSDAADLLLNLHYVYDHSIPSSPSTPNVEALIRRPACRSRRRACSTVRRAARW